MILNNYFENVEIQDDLSYTYLYEGDWYRIAYNTISILEGKGLLKKKDFLNRSDILGCCGVWVEPEYARCSSCGENYVNKYW